MMDGLRKLFQNYYFRVGFFVSATLFVFLNLGPHPGKNSIYDMFGTFQVQTGFPFPYQLTVLRPLRRTDIFYFGLAADVLIGIAVCFAAAFVWQHASESFLHYRKIKQFRAEAQG